MWTIKCPAPAAHRSSQCFKILNSLQFLGQFLYKKSMFFKNLFNMEVQKVISVVQTKHFSIQHFPPILSAPCFALRGFWPPINPHGCGLLWTYVCTYLFSYGKAIKTKRTSYLIVALFWKSIFEKIGQNLQIYNPICVVPI